MFLGVRHGIMTSLDSVPVSHSSTLQQAGLRTITTEHVQYISSAAGGGLAGTLASIVSSMLNYCNARCVYLLICVLVYERQELGG